MTVDAKNKPVRRKPRRWLPYAAGALLVGLLVFGLWPRPTMVETGSVITGPLRTTINEEGKTRIRHRYSVAAPVTGQLRRIPFKAGATVISNETVVAIIDPLTSPILDPRSRAQAEARRDAAKANLERSRAQLVFATSDLKRAKSLRAENTISPQEMESAEWRESSAAKETAAAESSLRQAEAELLETFPKEVTATPVELRAPASGRVLRVADESSRPVQAGATLLEIGNPADLEVVIEVLSRDAAGLKPGTPVELDQWGGREPLSAAVRYVEPAAFTKVSALGVEEQRVNVIADITTPLAAREQVGDNFRVEARIITWQTNQTVKVPSGAVFRRGADSAGFVIRDGKARLTKIAVGHSSGTEIEVLSGLKERDQLVIYPGDRIRDGMRILPIKVSEGQADTK